MGGGLDRSDTAPKRLRELRVRWIVTAVVGTLLVATAAVPIVAPPAPQADACTEPAAGGVTRLDGGYAVTAGSSGRLCFRSADGTISLTDDLQYGVQSSDGRWEVGVEAPGTRTARDSAGRTVQLRSVEGSDLLVWAAPQT